MSTKRVFLIVWRCSRFHSTLKWFIFYSSCTLFTTRLIELILLEWILPTSKHWEQKKYLEEILYKWNEDVTLFFCSSLNNFESTFRCKPSSFCDDFLLIYLLHSCYLNRIVIFFFKESAIFFFFCRITLKLPFFFVFKFRKNSFYLKTKFQFIK